MWNTSLPPNPHIPTFSMQASSLATSSPVTHGSGASGGKGINKPAPLTLKTVTSASGYILPPIYSFPAFFTRQPNPTTFASQSRQWQALVLSYCRYHRVFRIDLSEQFLSRESGTEVSELFGNARIKRRARPDFVQELIHLAVKSGSAMYDPPLLASRSSSTQGVPSLPSGTGAFILWRSIEEWGQLIYHWVVETGQTNSIMTFFELSEPSSTKDFADLPPAMLKMALQTLIKQNKAQIFSVGDGEGVKFL